VSTAAEPAGTPLHQERLSVPLRWWVQGTMLVATLFLALVVALPWPVASGITVVLLGALAAALTSYGSPRVVVTTTELRCGRAHVAARHLGTPQPLDAHQTRRAAGPEADARAFLLLRPYLRRAVRVPITDPDDPTPYWLVSSRRPDRLAAAVTDLVARAA